MSTRCIECRPQTLLHSRFKDIISQFPSGRRFLILPFIVLVLLIGIFPSKKLGCHRNGSRRSIYALRLYQGLFMGCPNLVLVCYSVPVAKRFGSVAANTKHLQDLTSQEIGFSHKFYRPSHRRSLREIRPPLRGGSF
jgi:hypothetical protein